MLKKIPLQTRINTIFNNNITPTDIKQIIHIINKEKIDDTDENIQLIYYEIIKDKIVTLVTPELSNRKYTKIISKALDDTVQYVYRYPYTTSEKIIDKYFERAYFKFIEFGDRIKTIIKNQLNSIIIDNNIITVIVTNFINQESISDENILHYYLELSTDSQTSEYDLQSSRSESELQSDPLPDSRPDSRPESRPESRSNLELQLQSESELESFSKDIRSDIPIEFGPHYNKDEEDSNIDTVEYDFDINHSRLRFTNDRDYAELKPNIIRYIELGCINIFSTIGCNETPEDRLERHQTEPYIIPHYQIYSTIDQIKKFSTIRGPINSHIFYNLPIEYDLINTLGNGYCLLNCFFIFSTITFGASRLTSLYNRLSEFRQEYLHPQTLNIKQSKKKTIHNFIKGIRALAHHFINENPNYDGDTKTDLHKAINDTSIPDTQFICNEFVDIANCAIINLVVDSNFIMKDRDAPYCKIPSYPINIDTEYCVVIQRNNTHYYLLLPQDNTKSNRKALYDYYYRRCI